MSTPALMHAESAATPHTAECAWPPPHTRRLQAAAVRGAGSPWQPPPGSSRGGKHPWRRSARSAARRCSRRRPSP
eukprot:5728596-Prymnesium_polylepis.2